MWAAQLHTRLCQLTNSLTFSLQFSRTIRKISRTQPKYFQVVEEEDDDYDKFEYRTTIMKYKFIFNNNTLTRTHTAGLLERQEESDTYVGIKQKILDKVAYCKQRRRVLLDHVREVGQCMDEDAHLLTWHQGQRAGVWEYQPKSMQEQMSSLRL